MKAVAAAGPSLTELGMANGLHARALLPAAGLALGALAAGPANAQFMSGTYPVIVVPPPPAQSIVIPRKPKPQSAQPVAPQPPPAPAEPPQVTCRYQGQTRVCE